MERDDEVRQIAYKIWEDEGYPLGRDQEHWFKAETTWQERQGQMEHMADDLLSRTDIVTPGAHLEPEPAPKLARKQAPKPAAKPAQKRAHR